MNSFRTFINANMRPDIQAFADVDGFAQLDVQLDHAGDLHGLGLLETFLDEDGVNDPPNRGRTDDPCPRVPCA